MIANRVCQGRHPAIQATALNGGAGLGVSLFDIGAIKSPTDLAIQLAGAGVDALTVYGAYRLYERAQDASDAPAPVVVPSMGNNNIVIINTGPGSPRVIVPTISTSDSHNAGE